MITGKRKKLGPKNISQSKKLYKTKEVKHPKWYSESQCQSHVDDLML
jgi:hypothetical protein